MAKALTIRDVKEETKLRSFDSWEDVGKYLQTSGEQFEYVITESLNDQGRKWFSLYRKEGKELVPFSSRGFVKLDTDVFNLTPITLLTLALVVGIGCTSLLAGAVVFGGWCVGWGFLFNKLSKPKPYEFDYVENAKRKIEQDKNQFKDRIAFLA